MSQIADELVTISELARLCNLDRATIVRRLEALPPVVDKAKEKRYRLGDALAELMASGGSELDAAKTRRAVAEADLKELELERERGEYLPRAEVKSTQIDLWQRVYRRCVIQLPDSLLPLLTKAENATHSVTIFRTELQQIFDELRRDHPSFR